LCRAGVALRGDLPYALAHIRVHTKVAGYPGVNFVDDGPGKPVGINEYIGRRPIAAFGNSDGDFQMLQWTAKEAATPAFGLIVHHTDAERKYAYDRKSSVGRLDKALDAADPNNWTVVSMKDDWKRIFKFQ